eukprot:SAG22_NODE_13772_length_395_cov_1.020270_1_plen_54_part_10
MQLDPAASAAAMAAELQGGPDARLAATAVANIVEENMANATRVHAGEKGRVLEA